MEKIILEIKKFSKNQIITFSENYYKSSDNKTIMGEVPFKEILFLDYRETEAGSNPREYTGLKKANLNIIKSLLKDYKNMFRFLHSGIIVSLVNPKYINSKSIQYDDCCLTNGNQTRFIILILFMLKILSKMNDLKALKKPDFQAFTKKYFADSEGIANIIKYIKFKSVNEIIKFLQKNRKYLDSFNDMKVGDFSNARIRIQINIINSIIEELDDTLDTYTAGTLIAEANNDTQNVKADDIFGTKHRRELSDKIFKDFNTFYKGRVEIEFRLGEVEERTNKVHILTLLRPVVATGIITKENDIFKFTNQRMPIYSLFEKLIRKDSINKTISAISKLVPLLYKIRVAYVEKCLEEHKRTFIRELKEKATAGSLSNTIIGSEIDELNGNDQELEKLIRRNIGYNIEHIMPVLVFRIRKLFEKNENGQLDLTVREENRKDFFNGLTEAIYSKYIETKLSGLPTSLTTVVRDKKFYEFGAETYIAFKRVYKLRETHYISQNTYIIR
jgi:hypothetical protein